MLEDGEYRTRTHLEVYSPHIPQHHSHVLSLFYVITSFDGREIRYDRPMRTRAINVFAARRPELAPDTAISAALAGSTSAIGDLLGHRASSRARFATSDLTTFFQSSTARRWFQETRKSERRSKGSCARLATSAAVFRHFPMRSPTSQTLPKSRTCLSSVSTARPAPAAG